MAAQVEIKLRGVSNASIDSRACWNVAALPNLLSHIIRYQINGYFLGMATSPDSKTLSTCICRKLRGLPNPNVKSMASECRFQGLF